MTEPQIKRSQRFQKAARAERNRLERKRSQIYERRVGLQARVDQLDQELEAVDQEITRLEDFAGSSPVIEIRETKMMGGAAVLTGAAIREIAVPLLIQKHPEGPIHYRDWYALLTGEGYAVAGKRPDAVFLNQVSRSPLVRATTKSGYYALHLEASDDLRDKLGVQQAELASVLQHVPMDSSSLEAHRESQRELSIEISRTERELDEAVKAIEMAERLAAEQAAGAEAA